MQIRSFEIGKWDVLDNHQPEVIRYKGMRYAYICLVLQCVEFQLGRCISSKMCQRARVTQSGVRKKIRG